MSHQPAGPDRLAALRRTDLLDSPHEEAYDRITRLVTRTLAVPVALVSLVDDSRQFFKSAQGLPEPWATLRETPLTHSFCQYVVADDAPLVVSDARVDARLRDNRAIDDLSVIAYAGMPLHGPGGLPIGSLCAIDDQPRTWTPEELTTLRELAELTSELISLRTAATAQRAALLDLSHRLRTGLTSLRLEAEELHGTTDGRLQEQSGRLVGGLQQQSILLDGVLRTAESGVLGHEVAVDLRTVLAELSLRAGAAERAVVVSALPVDTDLQVTVPHVELVRVLDAVVDLLLTHGRGQVSLSVLADPAALRVRLSDESDGLPAQIATALAGRADSTRSFEREAQTPSLAERAARLLGGRLVLVANRPPTIDLLLPRRSR